MKPIYTFLIIATLATTFNAEAQNNRSSASEVRINNGDRNVPKIRGAEDVAPASQEEVRIAEQPGSNVAWRRIVYKELDLDKDANATLYYPEDVIDGNENLFRIILKNVADGRLGAYEYLDGHEVFTPEFRINVAETLDKFHIPFTESNNSSAKNPRYTVDEYDVPANEVLSYYIIEQWEFDNVSNHTTAQVEAICPVLHRMGDFGEETLKYPMFWVPMSTLKPFLKNSAIFVDEFDVTPRYSLNDYFDLNLYDGEIYKTRNLRNKSLYQLYTDDESRAHAADSIQRDLKEFDKKLWVPSREEILEAREAKEKLNEELGEIPQRQATRKTGRRSTRASRGNNSGSAPAQGVTRSVRDKK